MKIAKQIKILNILLSAFILLIVFSSCNNKKNNEDYSLELFFLNKAINEDISSFQKYDSSDYNNNAIDYGYVKKISRLADNLVQTMENEKFHQDTLDAFIENIQNHSVINSLSSNQFIGKDKSTFIFKVRFYEYLAINNIVERFKSCFFSIRYVSPIVVPKRTEIKLGEEFIAQVFLCGYNKSSKFVAILNNGDTLGYDVDNPNIPIIREKPNSKGTKTIQGFLKMYFPNIGNVSYDFDYKYTVN